jgi:catechol 2,3-dioxygenase-like lactoylglutathione lyase family enzyme
LQHVALNVTDLRACERFYCEVLGLQVIWRPDEDNLYLSSGRDNDFLSARGVSILATPRTHRDGARSLHCQDPEGNTVQLLYEPRSVAWIDARERNGKHGP